MNGTSPLYNSEPISLSAIPCHPIGRFSEIIINHVQEGGRIVSLFGTPVSNAIRLYAILAGTQAPQLGILATDITGNTYPALTPQCPQAHWFEREIAEQWGIRPDGHPWLKPVRFHHAYQEHDAWNRLSKDPIPPGVTNVFRVTGEEVHEVAVGPVHAGIIEPGHFRFQCYGEHVMHLEIALGYQHRGIETALTGGPNKRTIHYIETTAGDTTIGHTLAYCQAIEGLQRLQAPYAAQEARGIALELERLANHTGDLGALAGDVGYLPTASFCGRLRGDILNMTALICGNRFGRAWLRPGGVHCAITPSILQQLTQRLENTYRDVKNAVDLLWNTPSVMARFTETGPISPQTATGLGLVGVAARAAGCKRDIRSEYPTGIYRFINIPMTTRNTGDVFARAHVRWGEINRSTEFLRERFANLASQEDDTTTPTAALPPDTLITALTEGWRGEICHTLITDTQGRIARYKMVDPSFHNWMGLAIALRNQQISDFPLCNKSFNLSYCGFDL